MISICSKNDILASQRSSRRRSLQGSPPNSTRRRWGTCWRLRSSGSIALASPPATRLYAWQPEALTIRDGARNRDALIRYGSRGACFACALPLKDRCASFFPSILVSDGRRQEGHKWIRPSQGRYTGSNPVWSANYSLRSLMAPHDLIQRTEKSCVRDRAPVLGAHAVVFRL